MSLTTADLSEEFDTVLVVDFGAQYAQLIARRVREAHVHSEIVPHDITAEEIARRNPKGVIFSGGPASVHADGAPDVDTAIYDTGVPVLGICYGGQLIARDLGGEVAKTGRGEYGRADLRRMADGVLFGDDAPEGASPHAEAIEAIRLEVKKQSALDEGEDDGCIEVEAKLAAHTHASFESVVWGN